ncbi:MAG: imidazole glycerol phosphate synthase subunit HisF [Bacteroidetes bacterium]|nr:MAG: imidazole glycerol phosphate synthase subunit HisF [Bacteroidota bacterium]
MFRPRIIPVLLLRNKGLVKSIKFKNHKYIGDPINAVKIFNDLKADELVFLDILASRENRTISLDFVKNVGEEANMPFAVGGGISTIEQIQTIIGAGAEKVIINAAAARDPDFIHAASETFGSSTIVVCIDVKKKFFGKEQTWILNGNKPTGISPIDFVQQMEKNGAGEIIIQSIDHDGTMNGYDIPLIRKISQAVKIPIVALGGAGNIGHLKQAYREGYANGLAAGSMFVYHGARKGILINYPEKDEISKSLFE